ncbi:MAG: TonB-dependent receptor [Acidobacteriaceae bacterium]|nr:TonB-dependent receptor [Acidobacteriaceae bacterium]
MRCFVFLITAFALATSPAKADELYARIRGIVTDASGARVPGAQITATNQATAVAREFASEADGSYELISLPVGRYTLSATKNGFQKFEASGIILTVNQVYVLNISLSPGVVAEVIHVEANPVQVETTDMQLGAVVNGQAIIDLPLNGRDWIQLQQLQPGVVSQSDRRTDTYATNGSQAQQNSFLINGADSNNFFGNTPAIIPSPDAIGEFRMVTNTINPEYGRNSGAIVNAVIKSGANQFHGSLFEFYRDTSLNATRWFLQTPDVLHRNQFGGTVGGPLWKDHTFFFLSYQGTRESRAENITDYGGSAPLGLVQVFTKAERGGNFSQGGAACPFGSNKSPIPLTDSSGILQPAGTPYCTLWPNGIVPTSDFNSVAASLAARYIPLPNSGVSGYSFNPVHTDRDDQGLFRIDHTISSKDSIWGYGLIERNPGQNALPFFGATLPGFAGTADRKAYEFAAAWNHTLSSTTLNEFRGAYTRTNLPFAYPVHPQLPSSAGFSGIIPQDPANAGIPWISVSGLFAMGDSPQGPEDEVGNTYQITDNLSRVSGRHSLKFGLAATRFEYNHSFVGPNNGEFFFSGAGAYSTGNPGLDFLLGIPDSYSQGSSNTTRARGYEYYVFAQDQYRLRDNLTLTYGLGWQTDTPLSNLSNNARSINCFRPGEQSSVYPTAPAGLIFPGDHGCTPSGYDAHYDHVGPRVGFAWSPNPGWLPGGPGKTSIRGGYGIYFNRSEDQPVLQSIFAPPFSLFSFGIGAVGGSPSFAAPFTDIAGLVPPLPNPFPYTIPSAANANFAQFEPLTMTATDPRFTVPYAENYNLTVERELPAKTILSLGYVGAVAHHLLVEKELNPGLNPQGCAANPTCVQFRSIQNIFFPNNFRYPGNVFGSVGEQTTEGNSNYNSFQANLRNSPSHGLQFSASYTWSHSLDIGSNFEDTGLGTRALNPFNPRANYGDSAFDARQRFVAYYSYQIPGRERSGGLMRLLTSGWEVSGITTLQTGFPITISSPGSYTSLTCTSFVFYTCWDVPNVTGPVQIYGNPRSSPNNLWFNPGSFSQPPFGVIGNARRNFFHGPGLNQTDLALHKWIPLGSSESQRLELRLEAFNVFNHAEFNNPDGNFTDGIPPNGTFGRILSAGPPRLVQLAAKVYF